MSLTISTDVFCDLCCRWVHGTASDTKEARRARRNARLSGWAYKRIDGRMKDLCKDCFTKFANESSRQSNGLCSSKST